ncbi:MAG: hypothetical protein HY738_05515 [Bacteroidia bacterium]|nr:hypothetical protein [Bacteroidia bacterium]
MAVTLPLLLFLLDYRAERKITFKVILEKIPFLLLSVVFGVIAISSQSEGGSLNSLTGFALPARILSVCYAVAFYVVKLLLPVRLCAMHYFPDKFTLIHYLSPIIIALVIFLIFKAKKHKKDLIFGALFFFFSISVVLQIFPFGNAIAAERYTYIPYLGLFYIIAKYLSSLLTANELVFAGKKSVLKPFLVIISVCYLLFITLTTYYRIDVWENGLTLFTDVVEKHPGQAHGRRLRGLAFSHYNQYDMAIRDYNKAIELNPRYKNAFFDRGMARLIAHDYENALNDFTQVLKFDSSAADACRDRGTAYAGMQMYDAAISDYSKAIELGLKEPEIYFNRGLARFLSSDNEGACKDWAIANQNGYMQAEKMLKQYCENHVR